MWTDASQDIFNTNQSVHVGGIFSVFHTYFVPLALSKANGVGNNILCILTKIVQLQLTLHGYSCYYSWDKTSEIWIYSMMNVHPNLHHVISFVLQLLKVTGES